MFLFANNAKLSDVKKMPLSYVIPSPACSGNVGRDTDAIIVQIKVTKRNIINVV